MRCFCFGDSNTYGYDPTSYFGGRYEEENRWVDVLASRSEWEVINGGMNGREIPHGSIGLPDGTDLLLVMLGSNDLLQGRSPQEVAACMEAFLSRLPMRRQQIVLIAPPPMQPGAWVTEERLIPDSRKLSGEYRALTEKLGIFFVDTSDWSIELAFDGVHFTETGHRLFAEKLWNIIKGV